MESRDYLKSLLSENQQVRGAIIHLLRAVKDLKATSPSTDYSPLLNQLNGMNIIDYIHISDTEWQTTIEINSEVVRITSRNHPDYLIDPSDVDAMHSSPNQSVDSEIIKPELTAATVNNTRMENFTDKFMRGLQYRYSDILPSADDQLLEANRGLTDSTNRESVFVVESDIQTEHQRIADELASLFVETELLETGHRIPQRNKVSNYSEIARLFKRGIALLRESDALASDLSLSRRLYTPVFASVARMMSSGMDDRTRDRL
jgi:hypothetical protein